jgi:hypothetical protein
VTRRPWRRRAVVVAASALVLLLAGTVPFAGPAPAQTPTPNALRLVSQAAWTRAGEPLTLRVGIQSARSIQQLDLSVRIYQAVRFRSQFALTLRGQSLGSTVSTAGDAPVALIPSEADGARTLTVPLPSLDTGVYPVEVILRDHVASEIVASFITYLVRVDDQVPEPLRVAWVQPIGGPPATAFDRTLHLDGTAAVAISQVTSALASHPTLPLTLDVTPETAAAAAEDRPDLASAIARTVTSGRSLLAAPYVDLDASRLVQVGLGDDLAAQRADGGRALTAVTGSSGSSQVWSADTALSPAAIGRLWTIGITTVVVPEDGLVPLDRAITRDLTLEQPFTMADADGHLVSAVSVDAGLAAHFSGADPVLAAQHLLADLAVLFLDFPRARRGVVIRPPAEWVPNAALLNPVFDGLAAGSVVQPVTIDGLVSSVPTLTQSGRPVIRQSEPIDSDAPGPATGPGSNPIDASVGSLIRNAREQLAGIRSMTGPAADLSGIERQLLVAEAEGLNSGTRRTHVSAVLASLAAVRGGVRLVAGRTFRLTAREGTIPFSIVNDNAFPVTVALELSSDKLEFVGVSSPDLSRRVFPDLLLAPGQRLVVKVLVRARASAAFPLRAVLRTPAGAPELARAQFTVVSTAVPGVGIVLSVGAGLVLVWWWVRHWRRTRPTRTGRHPTEHSDDERGPPDELDPSNEAVGEGPEDAIQAPLAPGDRPRPVHEDPEPTSGPR